MDLIHRHIRNTLNFNYNYFQNHTMIS